MNGGNLTVVGAGQGDTDPPTQTGTHYQGGTIKMIGQTGFDFDGTATYTGGAYSFPTMKTNGNRQLYAWRRWTKWRPLSKCRVLAVQPLVDKDK